MAPSKPRRYTTAELAAMLADERAATAEVRSALRAHLVILLILCVLVAVLWKVNFGVR